MKQLIRSVSSSYFYLQSFFKKREGVIVLMYHRINDSLPANDLVTPLEKFRAQMEYLKEHCEVIGMERLLSGSRESHWSRSNLDQDGNSRSGEIRSRPKLQVVITFDDGYMDNYTNAYPILQRLKLPATIFLITNLIGTDKKRPRYSHMPSPDMLSWTKVTEMARNGVTFASHTAGHPHLPEITYEEQKREIQQSISMLEAWVKNVVTRRVFCYPYGEYNANTLMIVRELGVKIALTTAPGINDGQTDPLEMRRTWVSGIDTLFDFKKKLAGAFDWMASRRKNHGV